MKKLFGVLVLSLITICCAFGLIACGDKGDAGAGIQKIEVNAKGQLVITLTDGTTLNPVDMPIAQGGSQSESLHFKKIDGKNEYRVIGLGNYSELDLVIPSTYKGLPVTEISGYAFFTDYDDDDRYCFKSVTIPNSITSVGDSVFEGCDILQYNVKDGLKYLGNELNPYLYLAGVESKNIVTANIDNNCKFIGSRVFYECSSLTSIEIPNSVTSIGSSAFRDCDSLTSITIPNSVTSIGRSAFAWCDSLTSVTIGNSVTSIGGGAFAWCNSLTSVTIGNSVTSIGDYAFEYCNSLTSIEIPNSVTSIGRSAFAGCSSLTIYCKAESKPSGWSDGWNPNNRPVNWGYGKQA